MRVVEIETQDQQWCYVMIDHAGMLVEPIVRYLKLLDRIGTASNTLHSYAIILTQIAWVKQQYTPEENPKRWLFPASKKCPHRTSQQFLKGNQLAEPHPMTTMTRL